MFWGRKKGTAKGFRDRKRYGRGLGNGKGPKMKGEPPSLHGKEGKGKKMVRQRV